MTKFVIRHQPTINLIENQLFFKPYIQNNAMTYVSYIAGDGE